MMHEIGDTRIDWDCECGVAGCQMQLAVIPGVAERTITIGIREDGGTIAQTYLSYGEARNLAKWLEELATKAEAES